MEDVPVIYAYTRAQAIADGVLIDVSSMAREAGFRYPVAMTDALWKDINDIPSTLMARGVSVEGRLWDILWMGYCAIRSTPAAHTCLTYDLFMRVSGRARQQRYPVKIVVGPGDVGESVITLMQPNES